MLAETLQWPIEYVAAYCFAVVVIAWVIACAFVDYKTAMSKKHGN